MLMFASVVDRGSLSAAGRAHGLSPSAVSKRIRALEDRLGVRLLNRGSRRVTLTEEGRVFYARCARIAKEVEDAEAMVESLGEEVLGTLRVTATVGFAKAHLLPLFPQFLKRFPRLELELELTDRRVNLAEERIDVAISFTEQVADPSVVSRRLASNVRVVCAAPSYLDASGEPRTPEELLRHNCLRLSTVSTWNDWEFENESGRRVLQVKGNFEANTADAVYHAALAGLGIARLPTYMVAGDLRSGRLRRLLPEFAHTKADILAIFPDRRNLSPKVRAFVDFLVAQFVPVPPWERNGSHASGPARPA